MPRACYKILLVDDNALTRMSAALILSDLGHQVIEACSGADALDALHAASAVDLVITDQRMPGMTGGDLAAAIKALQPDAQIVVSSGYGQRTGDGTADLPRLNKPAVIARVMQSKHLSS